MNKRLLFLFFACLGFHFCFASLGLLVSKNGEDKVFLLSQGAVVKLQYTGYQGQLQEFKGVIRSIDTQFVELQGMTLLNKQSFRIAIADILGFRPYSTLRQIGKSATELGLFAGNLVLYSAVISPAALPALAAAGISVGVGLASYALVRVIFPDKIKYKKEQGWSFRVVELANAKQ